MDRTRIRATASGLALPRQAGAPEGEVRASLASARLPRVIPKASAVSTTALPTTVELPVAGFPTAVVRDLRERAGRSPHVLHFASGDLIVVSGLPGSGKSTLMRRAVAGARVDSQDTRDGWDRRLARLLPYALYRPLVRLAHYAGLRRALRSGESVVVHDCGTQVWVRRWLARHARRRGATLHLLLLDVPSRTALAGQRARGRGVSRYAFARHRRTVGRLIRAAEQGDLPPGCASAVLLDRDAADVLRTIGFER